MLKSALNQNSFKFVFVSLYAGSRENEIGIIEFSRKKNRRWHHQNEKSILWPISKFFHLSFHLFHHSTHKSQLLTLEPFFSPIFNSFDKCACHEIEIASANKSSVVVSWNCVKNRAWRLNHLQRCVRHISYTIYSHTHLSSFQSLLCRLTLRIRFVRT